MHIVLAQLYLSVHFLLIETAADLDESQGCVSVKILITLFTPLPQRYLTSQLVQKSSDLLKNTKQGLGEGVSGPGIVNHGVILC